MVCCLESYIYLEHNWHLVVFLDEVVSFIFKGAYLQKMLDAIHPCLEIEQM